MDDLTIPDDARIRKRVGSAIEAFKQAVFPAGYEAGAKRTKRKVRALEFFYSAYQSLFFLQVSASDSSATSKRQKADEPVDIEAIARNETVSLKFRLFLFLHDNCIV